MEGMPQKRSSAKIAWLVAAVLAASALGTGIYHSIESQKRGAHPSEQGFDLSTIKGPGENRLPAEQQEAPQEPAPSGLSMVRGQLFAPKTAGSPGIGRSAASADSYIRIARESEPRITALALAYSRRYPIIREYGRDWMSYPDLKKLNDDYMRDHNPVEFAIGLSKSPNFPALVRKYAGQPEFKAFLMDAAKNLPVDAWTAASSFLSSQPAAQTLTTNIVRAAGIPSQMIQGLIAGSQGQPINQQQIINQILQSQPTPAQP